MCISVALNSFVRSRSENIELSHATHPLEGFFSLLCALAWLQPGHRHDTLTAIPVTAEQEGGRGRNYFLKSKS